MIIEQTSYLIDLSCIEQKKIVQINFKKEKTKGELYEKFIY